MTARKPRKFIVWAHVPLWEVSVEMAAGSTDEECEAACADELDTLIGNGDTGWNEITEEYPGPEHQES